MRKLIGISLLLLLAVPCMAQVFGDAGLDMLMANLPQYCTVLDGATQYWSKASPTGMDLNGAERITNANNRGFEVDKGEWADAGTHSIVRSTTDKRTGTASGKIVATGVGDATTNYVTIAASTFTTLVLGEKYTVEIWATSETATTTLTFVIGTQTKTSATLSTTPGTFTKTVLNFQAAAGDLTQPLIVYLSKAATVYIDDVSLTQAKDAMFSVLVKPTSFNGAARSSIFSRSAAGASNGSFSLWDFNNINMILDVRDAGGVVIQPVFATSLLPLNQWSLIQGTIDRTGNATIYLNGVLKQGLSIVTVGSVVATTTLYIGAVTESFTGSVGSIQFAVFNSLPSDIATTIAQINATYKRNGLPKFYTGGTIVLDVDWSQQGYDKSGTGNSLTGTGSPQTTRVKY